AAGAALGGDRRLDRRPRGRPRAADQPPGGRAGRLRDRPAHRGGFRAGLLRLAQQPASIRRPSGQGGRGAAPRRRAAGPGRLPSAGRARRRAASRHAEPGAARPPAVGGRPVLLLRRELPARGGRHPDDRHGRGRRRRAPRPAQGGRPDPGAGRGELRGLRHAAGRPGEGGSGNRAAAQRPGAHAGPRLGRRAVTGRVLVVDDSEVTRAILSRTLRGAGFEVLEARDGAEGALTALRERPSAVVTDLEMPTMDGFPLLRLLKADPLCANIPVLILTSHAEAASRFWSLRTGADAFLTKGYRPHELVDIVRRLVDTAAGAPQPPQSQEGAVPPPAVGPLEVLARVARQLDAS